LQNRLPHVGKNGPCKKSHGGTGPRDKNGWGGTKSRMERNSTMKGDGQRVKEGGSTGPGGRLFPRDQANGEGGKWEP